LLVEDPVEEVYKFTLFRTCQVTRKLLGTSLDLTMKTQRWRRWRDSCTTSRLYIFVGESVVMVIW